VHEESTTPDLAEVMLLYLQAIQSGDRDAEIRLWARNAVYDLSNLGLGTYEGRQAIRGFIEEWQGRYETYMFEPEEFLDLGSGVAFVKVRETGHLAGSPLDVRVEETWGWVFTVEQGMIVRCVCSRDIDEARAAAERLAQERG
jgi:ketosteroid isomerase-like protein